jgi:hypothetical protein
MAGTIEQFLAAAQARGIPNPEEYLRDASKLRELPNDLLLLLPQEILQQLDLGRLGDFANEDILSSGLKDIIPKMSNERAGTFGKDVLDQIISDSARRAEMGIGGPVGGVSNDSGGLFGGATPGYVFDPPNLEGSAQDLFRNFRGVNLPELDTERLFPWITDPEMAAGNLLDASGIQPGGGNPFAEFMQKEIPRMAMIGRIENILGGGAGKETDITAMGPRMLGGGITGSTGAAMRPQVANLARQYRDNPEGMTDSQRLFAEEFLADPEKALTTMGFLSDVAPDMRASQSKVNKEMLRRFGNKAAARPNSTIFDFLGY